jgi:hypothetical protein
VLARWPGAVSLRKLTFWFAAIGPAGMEALATSPYLGNLTELNLHGGFIRTPGAIALANSTTLRNLRSLSLGYNKIGPPGIQALLHSPNLAGVENLKISFNGPNDDGPGDAGLAALATSPTVRCLRLLDLAESRVTAEGARHLAGTAHLATLRSLDLHDNPVGPAGARHLAESPHLAGLRWLSLAQAGINDEAVRALATSPHLRPRVLLLARSAWPAAPSTAVPREEEVLPPRPGTRSARMAWRPWQPPRCWAASKNWTCPITRSAIRAWPRWPPALTSPRSASSASSSATCTAGGPAHWPGPPGERRCASSTWP